MTRLLRQVRVLQFVRTRGGDAAGGLEVLRELRGPLSGMALPHYVIDAPGGRGKIPLLPEYLLQLGGPALLRTLGGETIEFPNREI